MRKLMWFAIGFGAACAVGAYLYPNELHIFAAASLILSVLLTFASRRLPMIRFLVIVILAFSLGSGWYLMYDSFVLSPARQLDSRSAAMDITATDYSTVTDYGCRVSGRIKVQDREYAVLVSLNDVLACKPGDILHGTFSFRFTAADGEQDPTYHRGEGIFLLAYPNGAVTHIPLEEIPTEFFPQKLRMAILQRIDMLFPQDAAAFAKALILGDRSGIDYETNTAFKVGGISHIVAVSGLHVSILFSLAALFFGKRKVLLFCLGIPLLALFAAVTGFTPSVVRACIMQALMLTALLVNKEYDPPTALGFAALVMLIINPMVIISVSFQLSFGCMIGIFLFSEGIFHWLMDEKRLGKWKNKRVLGRCLRWFSRSVSITLSAGVVTTPLVAAYFGTVSLVSLLTNLLVVWAITYIFYGVLLACGISLLGLFAGRLFAWLTVYPIRFVLGTAKLIASMPLAAVYTESMYIVTWLTFTYLLLAVFLLIKRKPVLVFGCLSTLCLCTCLVCSWVEPLLDPCRLTVLDVGQGQCLLLQSDGKTFLIDCGGSSDTASADKAAETLLSQGIDALDGVIVTHYDRDHVGGIACLLTRIRADTVYLPALKDEEGFGTKIKGAFDGSTVLVSEDFSLCYGSTQISVFAPESYNLSNDSSLCVLFQRENCDILITGDRGSLGELLLLHRTELPQLDVLIAGHHGSAGSTGERLLEQTRPKYVMISAGRNNRYGHPSDALLERLDQYGCIALRTDLYGTILYRG